MRIAQNLYQKKDMLEWWNYKLCEEFDAIANTWLLDLDIYIDKLSVEHELQSGA
jgi:ABC-type metal ion transport system substrate-binding protein